MGYVLRQQPPAHTCGAPGAVGTAADLWRCDECGELYRLGWACDICDDRGRVVPHNGQHWLGLAWRPATGWQRFKYRKK